MIKQLKTIHIRFLLLQTQFQEHFKKSENKVEMTQVLRKIQAHKKLYKFQRSFFFNIVGGLGQFQILHDSFPVSFSTVFNK